MAQRRLTLTPAQQRELVQLRDHAPQPYLRERAAALLKVAAGQPPAAVARQGLLRRRKPDTVYAWLNRYQAAGLAGLVIRPGRGRKPAFSPSVSQCGERAAGAAAPRPACAAPVWLPTNALDPGDLARGVPLARRAP